MSERSDVDCVRNILTQLRYYLKRLPGALAPVHLWRLQAVAGCSQIRVILAGGGCSKTMFSSTSLSSLTTRDNNSPCTHPRMQGPRVFASSLRLHQPMKRTHETRRRRILPSSKHLRRFARTGDFWKLKLILVVAERQRRKHAKVL